MTFVIGGSNMNKSTDCPLCHSKSHQPFFAMPNYQLNRCLKCQMVWDQSPPKNLNSQYEEDYFINQNPKGGYANYFQGMQINRKTFIERLKIIRKKLGKKGRLLDVGCALGDCLEEAKKMGWKGAEGVELSKFACQFAKKRGLKVTQGMLASLNKSDQFDVITSQDMIEHVTNPLTELELIYKFLKPGGLVFIVTPDIGGWWSKLLGKRWYHFKPGEHVVYFSRDTIKKALEKNGFQDIETKSTFHFMSLEYIFNRLRYYTPIFNLLLILVKKTPAKNIPFKIYTGELEAWGQKPY